MTTIPTAVEDSGSLNPGLHPVLSRFLSQRGLTPEEIVEFLSWDLKALPDLTSMHDMEKAALRVLKAVRDKERIGIYGDYDVDGTTSCALFFHFFRSIGVQVDLFQPGRFKEGYGLHESSIDVAVEAGVKLLITVDCGITNNEAANYALDRQVDLIITDHHKDVREEMPKAYAVVNPNRRDEPDHSPLRALAGVGVAFALCLKVKKLWQDTPDCPSIYPLLQFVAVGTLCDMAHLSPMNLKLVRHGLKLMNDAPFAGLEVFLSKEKQFLAGKNGPGFVKSETVSFTIGPMINSKGRLEHPERALRLLTATEQTPYLEVREGHQHLEISNRERKSVQAKVFELAHQKCLKEKNPLINIIYDPDWHEGVIGIVASKLVEIFKVPAVVLTKSLEGNYIKASARTAGILDIFQHLKACENLFLKFGGHAAAAGFSMKEENLERFKGMMNESLQEVPAHQRTSQDSCDGEVSFGEVSAELVQQLNLLEPFGRGNPRPLFRMGDARLQSYTLMKDVHIRWEFVRLRPTREQGTLRGISFNYLDDKGASRKQGPTPEEVLEFQKSTGRGPTILFSPGINSWNGRDYLQLMVESVRLGSPESNH